ncbi:MAG: hypothetical protein R6X23_07630 [Acidimicrobiia bacterium]
MPRALLLLLGACATLGMVVTGLPAGPGAARAAPDRDRMMVLGDSVMVDAYPGVAAAARATGRIKPFSNAFPAFGLSNQPWRKRYRAAIRERRPDVVVNMIGGFDVEAARDDPVGYSATVAAAMRLLSDDGRILVWIGMLPGNGRFVDDGLRRALNEILRTEAADLPRRVVYLDPDPVFAGADGVSAEILPGPDGTPVRIRKVDGTHLCPDGAALLGLMVVDALRGPLGLSSARPLPDGAWVRGRWRKDPVYTESDAFDARTLELTSDVCPPASSSSGSASDSGAGS